MTFSWSRHEDGMVASVCSTCGQVVARSRTPGVVFRKQRAHADQCTPTNTTPTPTLTRR